MQEMSATEIAFAASLLLAVLTAIGYIVKVTKTIGSKADDSEVSKKIKELHNKIDDVKDGYVRRDDLSNHLSHLEASVKEVRDAQREMNGLIINALANPKS